MKKAYAIVLLVVLFVLGAMFTYYRYKIKSLVIQLLKAKNLEETRKVEEDIQNFNDKISKIEQLRTKMKEKYEASKKPNN